ncbi:ATP-binding protein [Paracoccaceae bacterium Fryx2]|nr:ATP-binding protein [Paracoccaceae bacterium Fryx2]
MEIDDPRRRLLDLLEADLPDPAALADARRAVESPSGDAAGDTATATDDAFEAATIASAALRGRFSTADRDIPQGATQVLGPLSETVTQQGRLVWTLQISHRMQALAALRDDGTLATALAAMPARPLDPLGKALRDLLAETLNDGIPTPPVALSLPQLETRLQAAEWFKAHPEGWPATLTGAAADLRREAALRAMRAAEAPLIAGFRGRKDERGRLSDFLARTDPAADPPPIFAISAEGGAGKSALLARFADSVRRRRSVPPWLIVRIDFDRRVLAGADPLELTFEFTRQLALQMPALDAPFADMRRETRSGGIASQMVKAATRSTGYRSVSEAIYRIGSAMLDQGQLDRPILLVLDTLEEALAYRSPEDQDMGAAEAIRNWLRMLAQAGLSGLRVIMAGRGISEANKAPFFAAEVMTLDELDPDSAAGILRDRGGLGADDAERLAAAFPRNPLVLQFLARLVSGPDGIDVAKLVGMADETPSGTGTGSTGLPREQIVQGVLYGRILNHIRNERVRALAHPGLVLRRVTPTLIRDVLAPNCGFGAITDAEATTMYQALVAEHWLVSENVPGVEAQHRRELRRTMLRLITLDARMQERAEAVHRAAIAHYDAGREPGIDAARSKQEALYHRIMQGHLPESAAARLDLAKRFDRDIADFPDPVQAALLIAADRPVSDHLARHLAGPDRARFLDRRGWELVAADRPAAALALLNGVEPQDHAADGWVVQARIDRAEWSAVVMGTRPGPPPDAKDLIPLATAHLLADRPAEAFDAATAALESLLNAHFGQGGSSYSSASAEFHGAITAAMKRALMAHRALGRSGVPEHSAVLSAIGAMGKARHDMAGARAMDLGHVVLLLRALGEGNGPELVALTPDHLRFDAGPEAPVWPVATPLGSLMPDLAALPAPRPGSRGGDQVPAAVAQMIRLMGPVARDWARQAQEDGLFDPRRVATEALWQRLRASSQDLHGAARHALADAVDSAAAEAVFADFAHRWPWPPSANAPRAIAAAALRGGLAFWATVVEFADRSGCLGALLQTAARHATAVGPARRLTDTAAALARWQALLDPQTATAKAA